MQFIIVENGARVSKILQVFSRQASLMDTLISGFVLQMNNGKIVSNDDIVDRTFEPQQQPVQPQINQDNIGLFKFFCFKIQVECVLDYHTWNYDLIHMWFSFADSHAALTLNNLTQNSGSLPSLSNKLSRLTLATFDENGHCIGQMGSWSFSY